MPVRRARKCAKKSVGTQAERRDFCRIGHITAKFCVSDRFFCCKMGSQDVIPTRLHCAGLMDTVPAELKGW